MRLANFSKNEGQLLISSKTITMNNSTTNLSETTEPGQTAAGAGPCAPLVGGASDHYSWDPIYLSTCLGLPIIS